MSIKVVSRWCSRCCCCLCTKPECCYCRISLSPRPSSIFFCRQSPSPDKCRARTPHRFVGPGQRHCAFVHHKVVRVVSGVCVSGIRRRGRRGRRHSRNHLRQYTNTTTVVVEGTNTTSGRHPVHEPDPLVKHG